VSAFEVAVEAGELINRGLRHAPADLAWRLSGGGVAGGLHPFPKRLRVAVGLDSWMRDQADRRNDGPSPRSADG
jgi:hypothetical protein